MKKTADPKLVMQETDFPNSQIDLSNSMTIKEFSTELPGLKIGDEKDITISYPDDYSDNRLAGASLTYHCIIRGVGERILPTLDDAFAKQTGEAETALELKLKIREQLTTRAESEQERKHRGDIIRQICEKNSIPVPEGLVDEYLDSVVKDFQKQYPDTKEEEIREHYRETGVNTLRWNILMHRLVDQEKVEVLPSDTENWIKSFADRNGMTADKAIEALNASGKATSLRESILEEKLLARLVSEAKQVRQ
jgi:trigger factor